jgi:hypothetical protein
MKTFYLDVWGNPDGTVGIGDAGQNLGVHLDGMMSENAGCIASFIPYNYPIGIAVMTTTDWCHVESFMCRQAARVSELMEQIGAEMFFFRTASVRGWKCESTFRN